MSGSIKAMVAGVVSAVAAVSATGVARADTVNLQPVKITASSVVEASNPSLAAYFGSAVTSGTSTTARANERNILGATDGNIYSLGELGWVVLSFGTPTSPFTGATSIVEVGAGGDGPTDREQAEVYVGSDVAGLKSIALGDTSNSLSIGHITSNGTTGFTISGTWSYMLIKDTSLGGNTTYGVDIDSVTVRPASSNAASVPVPMPASVWGGMGLMGALGIAKARRARLV